MPAPRVITDEQATTLYCKRCTHPAPLGIVSPGRYYLRHNGRTVLVTGGQVRVWCPQCSAEHDLDLADTRAMPTASAA